MDLPRSCKNRLETTSAFLVYRASTMRNRPKRTLKTPGYMKEEDGYLIFCKAASDFLCPIPPSSKTLYLKPTYCQDNSKQTLSFPLLLIYY